MEKPREDERFLEVGNGSNDRVMGPTKAVPDTRKICERWRRIEVCPQLVCNDFENVIVCVVTGMQKRKSHLATLSFLAVLNLK